MSVYSTRQDIADSDRALEATASDPATPPDRLLSILKHPRLSQAAREAAVLNPKFSPELALKAYAKDELRGREVGEALSRVTENSRIQLDIMTDPGGLLLVQVAAVASLWPAAALRQAFQDSPFGDEFNESVALAREYWDDIPMVDKLASRGVLYAVAVFGAYDRLVRDHGNVGFVATISPKILGYLRAALEQGMPGAAAAMTELKVYPKIIRTATFTPNRGRRR